MARLHKNMHKVLNDEALKKLRTINVNTVVDFLRQDSDRLEKLIKVDSKGVQLIKEQFIETFSGKIVSGTELLRLEEYNIVSTGISSLDELLNGGLHLGELYEFCGLSSAGKTQLCLSLAINVVLETDGVVRYIDTKNAFSGSRVQMILEAKDHNDEQTARVMNQIRVTRVTDVYELLGVLYDLTKTLKPREDEKPTKLVIIDSLPGIILASSEKSDSLRYLNHIAGVVKFLANNFHVSVITNNLVTQWREIDGFSTALNEKPPVVKPTLGKFWLHVPDTRLNIEKLTNEERKISVWKSVGLKIGTSCLVGLSDAGFT